MGSAPSPKNKYKFVCLELVVLIYSQESSLRISNHPLKFNSIYTSDRFRYIKSDWYKCQLLLVVNNSPHENQS